MLAKFLNRFSLWQRGELSSLWTEAEHFERQTANSHLKHSLGPDVVRTVYLKVHIRLRHPVTLNKPHSLHPMGLIQLLKLGGGVRPIAVGEAVG